jgi:penicillin-insensitive murein endopeptidase
MSQPRGGPMLTGHASHQIGLDADIWLTPMPNRRFSRREREQISATAVVKPGPHAVYNNVWTDAHFRLIKRAASHKRVQRIFVAPGIKKKLCESEKGNRRWLRKIRPYYGHNYHMHIRLFCPPGSPGCKPQNATPADDGCGKALAWWYSKEPYAKPGKPTKPPKPRKEITLAGLPAACRTVLSAANRTDTGPAPAAYSGRSMPLEGSAALKAMAPAAPLIELPVPAVPRSRPAAQ